jgi:hypothetical protein
MREGGMVGGQKTHVLTWRKTGTRQEDILQLWHACCSEATADLLLCFHLLSNFRGQSNKYCISSSLQLLTGTLSRNLRVSGARPGTQASL